MKAHLANIYRSPRTGSALRLEEPIVDAGEVIEGRLASQEGDIFPINQGIPDLVWPPELPEADRSVREFYVGRADDYDRYLPLSFSTFGEDERDVRTRMIDLLNLAPGQRVLEAGAGTGRDSELIAERIGGSGELYCQDISSEMLTRNRDRLLSRGLHANFALANAPYLPFPDGFLDAVFHFGGVGQFSDISRFFREVARVTKVGGRVVVGDESMPPWLRDTAFAKILTFTNVQFSAPLPLKHLPVEARDVCVRWIIGGTHFLIEFNVGSGEPTADIDFQIPGVRGGTHRTRYFGQLEGVKPETKRLATRAREKLGVSMHDWLDDLVRREARKVLGDDSESGGT